MIKEDDLGYAMLHRAVHMGTSLGIIGSEGPNRVPENLSDDMLTSARRTAWGLFQLDTYVVVKILTPRPLKSRMANSAEQGGSHRFHETQSHQPSQLGSVQS
jgi:hypothetical protein